MLNPYDVDEMHAGESTSEPTPPEHENDCWRQDTDDPCQQNLEVA